MPREQPKGILVEGKGTRTVYVRQIKVNASTNGKTVTDHVTMTEGYWRLPSLDFERPWIPFCVISSRVPEGLPLTDETSPVGTPFKP